MTVLAYKVIPGDATIRGRRGAGWLAIVCLLAACAASGGVAAQPQNPKGEAGEKTTPAYAIYTTQDGDTLYDIAARYLTGPADWVLLGHFNHVPAPRRMPAGIVLHLPASRLRQDWDATRVLATSGPVEREFRTGFNLPLHTGEMLIEGDRVLTGRNGFATLHLPDGSHVVVSQESELSIEKLRHITLTGATSWIFGLRHGEVEGRVTHATRRSDLFQIHSPSVIAGVRGTHFSVGYDVAAQTTKVAVFEGAVGIDPLTPRGRSVPPVPGMPLDAAAQLVTANFGNVTRADDAIGSPVNLLPAPSLVRPARLQEGQSVTFDVEPDEHAVGYHLLISHDARQLEMVRDLRVSSAHAVFDDLPDDTYFVRIASIDGNGLDGLPSVYAFERRQFGLAVSAVNCAATGTYKFRWFVSRRDVSTRFRFILAASADLRDPLVDRTDLMGSELRIGNPPTGIYCWTAVADRFENDRFYSKCSPLRSLTQAGHR
ncbi:FecR domain-containing protein [Paraburkholderia sp. MMS20-SJTR3]|uniref:FecR domain-containing protein n=1 Tax=Paraburkholderia sejongensis TaxID=2886946 RepID=A0ABS8K5D2_9BURK|nr:FecR domain-containing protein [Paraburkholderia sp. MMS20-SJTR3]MCC8397361.1 FecR domain-containing protein [Paraburkholderia sp. MMS20-SJTR3]